MSSESSGETDRSYRQCLTVATAAIVNETGFESAQNLALETLSEMMHAFLSELGRSIHAYTELACRQRPLPADILLALVDMGFNTQGLRDYAFRSYRKCLSAPGTSQVSKPPSILNTGDRKRHRLGGVVPENYVEFPDSHSYIRTPTHKQPVTDYESVREKAASQKRDVERALTRFIAKTGKTHSLFHTDDTNLFPLISCDRTPPDKPMLPPYINALLFRDQVFEEDEREFMPKKKKEEEEEEEEEDKDKKEEKDDDSDSKEDLEQEDKEGKVKPHEKKSDCKKEENDAIDNPYLRPVRVSNRRLI